MLFIWTSWLEHGSSRAEPLDLGSNRNSKARFGINTIPKKDKVKGKFMYTAFELKMSDSIQNSRGAVGPEGF